jgi:hypothetical protein
MHKRAANARKHPPAQRSPSFFSSRGGAKRANGRLPCFFTSFPHPRHVRNVPPRTVFLFSSSTMRPWLVMMLAVGLLAGADSSDFDDDNDGAVAAPPSGDMQTSVTIEVPCCAPALRALVAAQVAGQKEVVRAGGRARFPPRSRGKRACKLRTLARFLARCLGPRASVCSGVGAAPRPHSLVMLPGRASSRTSSLCAFRRARFSGCCSTAADSRPL